MPPRPEKGSFGVSEGPQEPSEEDGPGRRVADRTLDDTSPLQRALAGLTTAGEWAAQAEAEKRAASAEPRDPLGDAAASIDDAPVEDESAPAEDPEESSQDAAVSPRRRARQHKAERREARREAKRSRRLARHQERRTETAESSETAEPGAVDDVPTEVDAIGLDEAGPTDAETLTDPVEGTPAENAPVGVDAQADVDVDDDAQADAGSAAEPADLPVDSPRTDTRARRASAKHARRAAALERRQVRAEAKVRRGAGRHVDVTPDLDAAAEAEEAHELREPDEIDRELAADEVTSELSAVAADEAERLAAEELEAERVAAEQARIEQAESERVEAERVEAERAEAERAEAERVEIERVEAGRAAAAAVAETPEVDETSDETPDEPETDWEDVERRASEAALAVSARAAAREQKASDRQRKIQAKAAARAEKERVRREAAAVDDVPEPPDEARSAGRTSLLTVVAAVVGAGGLILSVVLAVGAMLAALGTDSGALYSVVSTVCDVLTAPLAGLVDFTGSNAAQKEALVAWGLGSIVYLAIGLGAQSLLRARTDDD